MAHQNIVCHVWTTSHQLQKLMTKLQVNLFVMVTELLYNFSFVKVRVQVTVQDIILSSQTCVRLEIT